MHSSQETHAKRLHATDETEDAARKRLRTESVGQFSSLPVEIVQIVLNHLITLISPKDRIHFHKNHQDYNRYLAELGKLVLVSKLFNKLLTPHLYREIRLPREFGYAASLEDDFFFNLVKEDDTTLQNPRITTDSSAVALARLLEEHPEKAALIKRLHIDPVARTQNRDATDCGRIHSYSATMFKHGSDGDKRTFRVSDSKNQVLQRTAKARMPQLKHLMLKSDNLSHLDWIAWDQLYSLEEVTVLTEHIFHLDPDFFDFEDATEDPEDNDVFQVLMRLPSTVKNFTFGFVYTFEWDILAYTLRGDNTDQHEATRFGGTLASVLKRARNHDKLQHLESIRLVWAHSPDDGPRCDCCLIGNKSMWYPLPRLRPRTQLEELCAGILADHVCIGDSEEHNLMCTSSAESIAKPQLKLYEVRIPPSHRWDLDGEAWCMEYAAISWLETLWRSLLYGRSELAGDEGADQEIEHVRRCISPQ
ncbi:hypothetical protein OC861_004727 [Tilletia horrida]|nr:hypothetical protein OC861_004727 [Tilletia horrida]